MTLVDLPAAYVDLGMYSLFPIHTCLLGEAKKEMLKNFASDFEKNGYLSPKWPKYESQVVIYTTLYFKNSSWVALKT